MSGMDKCLKAHVSSNMVQALIPFERIPLLWGSERERKQLGLVWCCLVDRARGVRQRGALLMGSEGKARVLVNMRLKRTICSWLDLMKARHLSEPGGHTYTAYHFHCVNKAWTSRDSAQPSTLRPFSLPPVHRHQYAEQTAPP